MKFKEGDIVQVKGAYPCIGIVRGHIKYESFCITLYEVKIIKSSLFPIGEIHNIEEMYLMEFNGEI